MNTVTSKHAIAKAKKQLKLAREEYELARWTALAAGRQARARRSTPAYYVRAKALSAACHTRFWFHDAEARLASLLGRKVVAHGGHWSPAALKRNGFDPTGA